MNKAALTLIAICFSPVALAAPTVRDHLQNISRAEYQASMNIWFDGAVTAFLAGNAELTQIRNTPPLFCLQKGQTISSADTLKLVNQEISSQQWRDNIPPSIVLLGALKRSFPCN